jgi:hypothetical protein
MVKQNEIDWKAEQEEKKENKKQKRKKPKMKVSGSSARKLEKIISEKGKK